MSKKISQLTATTTSTTGDEYALARSGANYKIDFANLSKAILSKEDNNAYVDATYGSDVTGTLENKAFPYQTILAAQTAAAAIGGFWNIVISTGTYTDNNLGATGMNYHFMPYTYLTSANNCFRDNGVSIIFSVTGHGRFTSSGGGSNSVVNLTATSTVYFEGLNATSVGIGFTSSIASILTVRVKDFIYTLGTAVKVVTHAASVPKLFVYAARIESEYCIVQTTAGLAYGQAFINAETLIVNTTGTPLGLINHTGGDITIHGDCYANEVGTSPLIHQLTAAATLNVYGRLTLIGASNINIATGEANFYGTINAEGYIICSGGVVTYHQQIISTYTAEALSVSSGVLRINNRVVTGIGSANNHGVVVSSTGALQLNRAVIVCDSTANSVYAASAKNIKVYYAVANYAAHANITNIITGTSIIVDTDVS